VHFNQCVFAQNSYNAEVCSQMDGLLCYNKGKKRRISLEGGVEMAVWANFFVAEISAAAALTGLIFVGVSINLSKILQYPGLPNLALDALATLGAVLILSSLVLIPGQPAQALGLELLLLGVLNWVLAIGIQFRNWRNREPGVRAQYMWTLISQIVLRQATTAPFAIAGAWLLIWGTPGLYWLVPGVLLSFIVAIMEAWILLIEINR
jgi:hypothetical protein